ADQVLDGLAAIARKTGCTFNCYNIRGNDTGAECLGLTSGNTRAILESCIAYETTALWLSDCNPLELYPDQFLVQEALECVDFLVVQGSNHTSAMPYASVILPSAAPAEQNGTYINAEGRLQHAKGMIPPPGETKSGWRIYSELLARINGGTPYFNPGEILQAIASECPSFVGVGDGDLLQRAVAGRAHS
ncbi:MAG: molybdopterin-dependent oxidoreductase, partial [Fimbriimonadaceae bacterium]|nr:molybdopterin-dependent oxidoreductase [Fimbriimonadaceae bacterium]